MNKLRVAVIESNATTPKQVLEIVEETICEVLENLDNQASILCEKHDGATEMVHYYMGKGMNCREVASELGLNMEFDPLSGRENL